MSRKPQYHKDVSPHQIYNCGTLPIKIPIGVFVEQDKQIVIYVRKNKRPTIVKVILKIKMGDSLRFTLK